MIYITVRKKALGLASGRLNPSIRHWNLGLGNKCKINEFLHLIMKIGMFLKCNNNIGYYTLMNARVGVCGWVCACVCACKCVFAYRPTIDLCKFSWTCIGVVSHLK